MSFTKCMQRLSANIFRSQARNIKLFMTIRGKSFSTAAASPDTATQAKLVMTDGGKRLQAVWGSDGEASPSNYHAVWLRHNCQCQICVSSYNQPVMKVDELDPKVKITDVRLTDEGVKMKWSCGHEGHVNLDWLRRHCYSNHSLDVRRKNCSPLLPQQAFLPRMEAKELKNEEGILRWLKTVSEYGVCLVTGQGCSDKAGLQLCNKITPNLQSNYNGAFDKIVMLDKPTNVAEDPVNLLPHMDTTGYESPPGLVILQCTRRDDCVKGGENTLIDCLAAAEKLRVTHPHHFATLARVPATFQRIHYDRGYPIHMVYRTPHIHLNKHGEVVKLRWSPYNCGPLQVPEEDVEPYYDAFLCLAKLIANDKQFQVHHVLEPGDVLVINNFRMLHGRSPIQLNGGVRALNNITINIDEFKSRLQFLSARYDPDYQPKNILNHDFSFSAPATATANAATTATEAVQI